KGTLDAQDFEDALKKHEQSRNHPDATTTAKGFTKLDNQVGDSQTTSLTPFGAQKELENYLPLESDKGFTSGLHTITSGGNYTKLRLKKSSGRYIELSTQTGSRLVISESDSNGNPAYSFEMPASDGRIPLFSEVQAELNKKIDKASISNQLANDVNKVPSLDLLTKELGKKQVAGNYADKSSLSLQQFRSGIYTPSVDVVDNENRLGLRIENGKFYLNLFNGSSYQRVYFPFENGDVALESYGYSKTESNLKFQPTGNYADKTTKYTQKFESALEVTGEVQSSTGDIRLALKTASNVPTIIVKYGTSKVWKVINVPDKSGTMALVGESYTTAQSDNKYQLKGNYADKSSLQTQEFASRLTLQGELRVISPNSTGNLVIQCSDNGAMMRSGYGEGWKDIKIPQLTGTMALTSDVENSELVPHPIPWSLPTAPAGYLICQGQTFNKATYPKLAIAYPSGRLPELRSEFIRGADAGRGIDTGREVLSSQSGNSLLSARGMGSNSEFSLKMSAGSVGTDNQGQREIYQQIEGQNGNETRPRNIAFLYIVRAA
ncbi:phage tail protein, partial [Acinetobacter baumannii]|uniref:phage tail protein n=1 Tax=Acinetobacter baumannii TaxID=470 RepID=UPI0034CF6A6C